jgi:hypothetical protein
MRRGVNITILAATVDRMDPDPMRRTTQKTAILLFSKMGGTSEKMASKYNTISGLRVPLGERDKSGTKPGQSQKAPLNFRNSAPEWPVCELRRFSVRF